MTKLTKVTKWRKTAILHFLAILAILVVLGFPGLLAGTQARYTPALHHPAVHRPPCAIPVPARYTPMDCLDLHFWQAYRSKAWSSRAANIPPREVSGKAGSVAQRRILTHLGTRPGPGQPESPESSLKIKARLLARKDSDLSGTNQNILSKRYFTRHNQIFGETFENGGY